MKAIVKAVLVVACIALVGCATTDEISDDRWDQSIDQQYFDADAEFDR